MRIRNMRNIRKFTVIVATCLLCLARLTVCDVNAENSNKNVGSKSDESETQRKEPLVVKNPKSDVTKSNDTAAGTKTNLDKGILTSNEKSPALIKAKSETADTENTSKIPERSGIDRATSLNTGALLRGFYVFVGLSVLALAYMIFRSFRLNKSHTQMVRKYGVLAHRQDMEMRPLPLDEDDEDDTTVFDASGLSLSTTQTQSQS